MSTMPVADLYRGIVGVTYLFYIRIQNSIELLSILTLECSLSKSRILIILQSLFALRNNYSRALSCSIHLRQVTIFEMCGTLSVALRSWVAKLFRCLWMLRLNMIPLQIWSSERHMSSHSYHDRKTTTTYTRPIYRIT